MVSYFNWEENTDFYMFFLYPLLKLLQITLSIWPLILLVGLFYYYLVLPVNWIKDLTDVGYDTIEKEQKRGKRNKYNLVEEIQRKKKIGNVPPVYPNGWFVLCESSELARGDVKYITALGENFAVFRSKVSDAIYILDAYCRHLGANLAVGGSVHGNCLQCPFHGWRFNGETGACDSIPYSSKVPESANVKKWHSREINELIFVWYHAEGIEPNWSVFVNSTFNTQLGWIYRGKCDFLINTHIQDIYENGCDSAHFEYVHGDSIISGGGITEHKVSKFEHLISYIFRHNWTTNWSPLKRLGTKHMSELKITHNMSILNKIKLSNVDINVTQIGPGYMEILIQSTMGPIILTQTITPVEPLIQRVLFKCYCVPTTYLYSTFILKSHSVQFQRDIAIWNHKKYEARPLLVKSDETILALRRWYSRFYSENSPTLKSIQMKICDFSLQWAQNNKYNRVEISYNIEGYI